MPHATEGDLHAYLDGALSAIEDGAGERLAAHLTRCADCRARLDEERAIRDRAGELLGVALPAVEPPPFETVVGGSTQPRRSRLSTERLAWAAAVVMALGAGWMGNALLRGSADSLISPATPALRDSVIQTGADADLRAEIASPVGAEEREQPGRVVEDVVGGEASELQSRPPADLPAEPSAARARVAGEAVSTDEPGARRDLDAVAGTQAEAIAPDSERFADKAVEVAARENAKEPRLTESDEAVAWRLIDEGEATAWLGRAPLTVGGLVIVSFEGAVSEGVRVLRVKQRLPGGEDLVLLQEVAGATDDLAAGGGLERAERQAVAAAPVVASEEETRDRAEQLGQTALPRNLIDGVWVTLQAPLASDSLRVLLSHIR